MRKLLAVTLMAILLSSVISSQSFSAYGAKNTEPNYVPDRLLVKFKKDVSESQQKKILADKGAVIENEISQIKVKILKVPKNALNAIESAFQKNSAIEYVEKDFLLEPTIIPNDPEFSKQWHLSKIKGPEAWDITKGSQSVPIAILDTGIDSNHSDLSGKLLPGYNFYDNNNNLSDVCGHGTKVAGSAAAITNNGLGVAGVSWESPIIPIKVTDPNCFAYYSTLTKGIIFAADNGAKVANISFAVFDGKALTDAATYMYNKGGWVVASAGNSGKLENLNDNPYLISVSSTDSNDNASSFSSSGPYVDFAAPGSSIYTTTNGGSYGYTSGTSFSSPITAGLIALMFSHDPTLTPAKAYDVLKQSSVDLGTSGYDYNFGWGRINAYAAIQELASTPIDNIPPNVSITNPIEGSTVSGTITVDVSATDNDKVSKVELYVDSQLQSQKTNSPYSFSLDTTKFANGPIQIKAVAFDPSNNSNSAEITVNVSNIFDTISPTVKITNPTNGATVSGKIKIQVSASDNMGIGLVKIYIDGVLKASLSSGPYDYSWNTRSSSDGPHTITAEGIDLSGNIGSTSISVTVAQDSPNNKQNPPKSDTKNNGKSTKSTEGLQYNSDSEIPEFNSGVLLLQSSTTTTQAIEFLNNVLVDLQSGSRTAENLGSEVSVIAQLHKLLAHESKEDKKLFQQEFHKFRIAVKELLGIGQGVNQRSINQDLAKVELKLEMELSKQDMKNEVDEKIKSAIELVNHQNYLQNALNEYAIAKYTMKDGAEKDKKLEELEQKNKELLKKVMTTEVEHGGKKLTSDDLKEIDKKVEEKLSSSNNNGGNSQGSGDKSKNGGNSQGSGDKSNNGGNSGNSSAGSAKSDKGNSDKGKSNNNGNSKNK